VADQGAPSHIDRALRNTNSGIPFQSAVVRYCEELFHRKASRWVFEVAEFPVSVNGADTRIDFVLYGKSTWANSPSAYLVCECKRPNPAIADWVFMRSPYRRRGGSARLAVFESIMVEPTTGRLHSAPRRLYDPSEPYDFGLVLKGAQKGDPNATESGRSAIEDTATQVCRGVGGLIDFFKNNPKVLDERALVVPVIFTTAHLHVSSVDLGAADLNTGKLPDSAQTSEVPWLWFQYNLSTTLRHTAQKIMPEAGLTSLGSVLEYEHARSIAIVSPSGIESFLQEMPDKLDATDALSP